jgi:hypothetical protein
MKENWQIIPGKGFGHILFGISKDRLVELLGEPDELDGADEDGETIEQYYYDDLDAAFTFSSLECNKLLVITIGDPQYIVAGQLHTGMEMKEALQSVSELDWEQPDIETVEKDNLIYRYDKTGVEIWFEDGVLTGFQLTPQWKDEDTIAWPMAT